ncbi:hypothetical protein P261_00629 [Lachnospiraceae bacterium TWA4]|nr:hypothetical protein P261_00629 [Lachnospiraceae bacterium TWA4]
MKKTTKIIMSILFILSMSIIVYYNFISPVKIVVTDVKCQNWDATFESIQAFATNYRNGDYDKNTTIIHNFNEMLPSKDPKEYMTIYITLKGTNRCLFEPYLVDGFISKMKNHKDMALYSFTLSDVEPMQLLRSSEREGQLVLDVFIGNRSNEEIKKFVQGLTIWTTNKGKFFGEQKAIVQLDDVEKIYIER